jgi:hypothetical protein
VIAEHGACGKRWKQSGNRTSHCGACHRTFASLALFDWHQTLGDGGRVICRDPAEGKPTRDGSVILLDMVGGIWSDPTSAARLAAAFKTEDDE